MQKYSMRELYFFADHVRGEIWNPKLDVHRFERELGRHEGWYWRDLNESPSDQWRGPFPTERAAVEDFFVQYAVINQIEGEA